MAGPYEIVLWFQKYHRSIIGGYQSNNKTFLSRITGSNCFRQLFCFVTGNSCVIILCLRMDTENKLSKQSSTSKRIFRQTSPDESVTPNSKKHIYGNNKPTSSMPDQFSWDVFEQKMEKMLENVAKKEDIMLIRAEIDGLKKENEGLRTEINYLHKRMERIDKDSRKCNIVISGLKQNNDVEAKNTFSEMCINILKVEIDVIRFIKIKSNTFLVELGSGKQAHDVLRSSNKLKGSGVFVQKDFTPNERTNRFHLRQLCKVIKQNNANITCICRDTTLYVNNSSVQYQNNAYVMESDAIKSQLQEIVNNAKFACTLVVKNKNNASTNINNKTTNVNQ